MKVVVKLLNRDNLIRLLRLQKILEQVNLGLLPGPDRSLPLYAAFPLQPEQRQLAINTETKAVQVGVTFALTITFPKSADREVQAALWARETFGGLGARTRRGFGALKRTDAAARLPTPAQAKEETIARLNGPERYVTDGPWPADVPYLSRAPQYLRVIDGKGKAIDVWNRLIDDLKDFRQHRPGAGTNRPGAATGRNLMPSDAGLVTRPVTCLGIQWINFPVLSLDYLSSSILREMM